MEPSEVQRPPEYDYAAVLSGRVSEEQQRLDDDEIRLSVKNIDCPRCNVRIQDWIHSLVRFPCGHAIHLGCVTREPGPKKCGTCAAEEKAPVRDLLEGFVQVGLPGAVSEPERYRPAKFDGSEMTITRKARLWGINRANLPGLQKVKDLPMRLDSLILHKIKLDAVLGAGITLEELIRAYHLDGGIHEILSLGLTLAQLPKADVFDTLLSEYQPSYEGLVGAIRGFDLLWLSRQKKVGNITVDARTLYWLDLRDFDALLIRGGDSFDKKAMVNFGFPLRVWVDQMGMNKEHLFMPLFSFKLMDFRDLLHWDVFEMIRRFGLSDGECRQLGLASGASAVVMASNSSQGRKKAAVIKASRLFEPC